MTQPMAAGLTLLAAAGAVPADAARRCDAVPATGRGILAPDVVGAADAARSWPTFCSIPATPRDVPPPPAFRAAVVDTRLAGRTVVADSAPDSFHLADTAAFSARARREAAAPPPIATPGEADTEAFIRASRAAATPPRAPRKR
ncbi:MAG: hypothetical protein ABI376_06440 [Caulobacteraceae bacterium]